MCQVCAELVEKYLSGMSDDEKDFILWNMTAFPFVDTNDEEWGRPYFEKQLREARDEYDRNGIEGCYKKADDDMERQFAPCRWETTREELLEIIYSS